MTSPGVIYRDLLILGDRTPEALPAPPGDIRAYGWVFLFDRTNGKPLFPLETHKYPASVVPGEQSAETQVLPTKPAPFARQLLTADMRWRFSSVFQV